jgi:hypothetical protein
MELWELSLSRGLREAASFLEEPAFAEAALAQEEECTALELTKEHEAGSCRLRR